MNRRPEASERFFAICPRGLEPVLVAELDALAAHQVRQESGGVAFSGGLVTAYAANLHSRIASRVLWQIDHGPYSSERDIYARALAVAWENLLSPQHRLRVDVSAQRCPLRSLDFVTLRIKDAIVDRLRESTGSRPSIDRSDPDVRVFAHLDPMRMTLYLDLSGEPLFKRGWRADKGEAPLKENLAAGVLALSGWTPAQPLFDPFCGSGTIAIEAACIASGRAPGLRRGFAFQRLASFDADGWRRLVADAASMIDDRVQAVIVGSDISARVIELARANAVRAGLQVLLDAGGLRFDAVDARTVLPPADRGLLVTNPPYGEQSQPKSATVAVMMSEIGNRLKQAFAGWQAWLLTSDRNLPRQLRLQETRKTVLYNGPIECRLFRFDLVSGAYRPRAQRYGSEASAAASEE